MATRGYRVVLDLDHETRREYARLVGILCREWEIEQPEDAVLLALRKQARQALGQEEETVA